MRLARHVAVKADVLVGKPAGRILGKPKHIGKDIIEAMGGWRPELNISFRIGKCDGL